MNSDVKNNSHHLFYWNYYFALANTFLFWLIGYSYFLSVFPLQLPFLKPTGIVLAYFFIFITYLSHYALLAFLPCLLLLPFSRFKQHKLIMSLAILLTSIIYISLFLDSHIYERYHFHLNTTLLSMLFSGDANEIFSLSHGEWLLAWLIIIGLLLIELLIARYCWIFVQKKKHLAIHKKFIYLLITFLIFSYYIFVLTAGIGRNEFTQQTRALFLYDHMLGGILPFKHGLQKIDKLGKGMFTQPKQTSALLKYPLHPVQCKTTTVPLNIVMIVIDSWRFDMLNKTVTPNITTFAESAWQFRQHFSGGNSTKPGMFSLFYSLPSHYWSAMLDQKQGPVFIKTLLEKHYATRIFCSAEIEVPPYYATLFHDIPNLPLYTPGNTPGERDRYITQEFQQFLTKRNSQEPFFSLLFYNAAHGFCQPQPFEQPFQPTVNHCNRFLLNNRADPTPYRHRYQNALYFIDKEVNKVLSTLKQQKLLNNTVIIITGDHGQEFNDTHHNSWEHASNYTPYQLQTPLVIYWPKHSANIFNHQTSHYDIIPLLMRQALACDNPPSDYSIGDSLLDDKPRQYLIAGSYTHFGIIEHDRITTIFPSGRISISDPMMNPLPKAKPRLAVVNQVMHDLRKFFAN